MTFRGDVAPSTLGVELNEDGVVVEYLDGRNVFYHGPPEKAEGSVRAPPGKLTQVLVTDPTETEGVLVYVNDHDTHDDILEDTGVGRVLLEGDDEEELFPGVTVRSEAYATVVEADPEVARGRVFVFAEDEISEHAYEIV
ncbi:hypothetical protein G9C85_04390 [Halorubellus sp. JP-L1]|uniref:DUF5796 family protein n=1 Tax=Halorubellus sp. JP-L1 TaxID=2715753 RepID=UPI00140D5F32|nr:DUF5796 family protein [Halorubellus sp. JP-L1]NHN40873.1 hypothetical protein [Halorubellus sp. JP-L1]